MGAKLCRVQCKTAAETFKFHTFDRERRCTKDEIWMEEMAGLMLQPMRAEKELNTDDFLYPSN